MDVKKIGGILLTVGIVAVVIYSRMEERQQSTDAAEAAATGLIVRVDGYADNQKWYDDRTSIAVSQAVSASSSFQKVGRRSRNVFDETLFLPNFFEKLIAMAQNEGKTEIVKALIALRDQEGIQRPGDIAKD